MQISQHTQGIRVLADLEHMEEHQERLGGSGVDAAVAESRRLGDRVEHPGLPIRWNLGAHVRPGWRRVREAPIEAIVRNVSVSGAAVEVPVRIEGGGGRGIAVVCRVEVHADGSLLYGVGFTDLTVPLRQYLYGPLGLHIPEYIGGVLPRNDL
jgi:hypothetical protein